MVHRVTITLVSCVPFRSFYTCSVDITGGLVLLPVGLVTVFVSTFDTGYKPPYPSNR